MSRDNNNDNRSKQREENTDLPGYPHYPSREDITDPENNNGKVNFTEENITIPDVRDIAGQEHINPAPIGSLGDTTASSDDEEGIRDGKDIFEEDNEDDIEIVMGTEADVTEEDLLLLGDRDQDMDMGDDESVANFEGLDDTDLDGEKLNEESGTIASTGDGLDIPDENGGNTPDEDDEENNYYSLGSDDNDNLTEGTP